jgi:hypothetical protein
MSTHAARTAPHLRLVTDSEPLVAAAEQPPMPMWQALASAHWYVSWSIARVMYDAWDRSMRGGMHGGR